jgi:hypothetical protein
MDLQSAISSAQDKTEFEEHIAKQKVEFEEHNIRERARKRKDFEDYIAALERKQKYRNLSSKTEDARLLRNLVALFSYNARIVEEPERPERPERSERPEGCGFPMNQDLVDEVRRLIEEAGTDDLAALVEVVSKEAGRLRENVQKSLKYLKLVRN